MTELPLQNTDLSPDTGANDMCSLNYLHEAALLHNLRLRFFAAKPYTYTGDICIAVNPCVVLFSLSLSLVSRARERASDRAAARPRPRDRVGRRSGVRELGLPHQPRHPRSAARAAVDADARKSIARRRAANRGVRRRERNSRIRPPFIPPRVTMTRARYRWLEHLYKDETREQYTALTVSGDNAADAAAARAELPPHVYAVSAAAYRGLAGAMGADQSILVSGASSVVVRRVVERMAWTR